MKRLITKIMGEPKISFYSLLFMFAAVGSVYILTDTSNKYMIPDGIRLVVCYCTLFVSTIYLTYDVGGSIYYSIFTRKK